MTRSIALFLGAVLFAVPNLAYAQGDGGLHVPIDEGVIEPVPIAPRPSSLIGSLS